MEGKSTFTNFWIPAAWPSSPCLGGLKRGCFWHPILLATRYCADRFPSSMMGQLVQLLALLLSGPALLSVPACSAASTTVCAVSSYAPASPVRSITPAWQLPSRHFFTALLLGVQHRRSCSSWVPFCFPLDAVPLHHGSKLLLLGVDPLVRSDSRLEPPASPRTSEPASGKPWCPVLCLFSRTHTARRGRCADGA